MLPVFTKTYILPFGSKISSVVCTPEDITQKTIDSKIKPASKSMTLMSIKKSNDDDTIVEDKGFYQTEDMYPEDWFDYIIGAGLHNEKHVNILSVRFYPIRYIPCSNTIVQAKNFDIDISYEKPVEPLSFASEYDMVIICPKSFSKLLKPLVNHKNNLGIRTTLKTTQSIYLDATLGRYDKIGRDKPEKIKYFIENALEEWGIKYVLLVGGMKGQLRKWYVPVRYSRTRNPFDIEHLEKFFVTDLYYADIYDSDGHFSDWDTNNNLIIAEFPEDEPDYLPDVSVGRLPCRNRGQVKIVVNKIIEYETNTFGSDWFKNMTCIAGDTFPNTRPEHEDYDVYEGEVETEVSSSYLIPLGFNVKKLYASLDTLNGYEDIVDVLHNGSGIAHFAGHGNPAVWSTHEPNNTSWLVDFLTIDMASIRNGNETPVVVVGGCSNSKFDVTILNLIRGFLRNPLRYFGPDGKFGRTDWIPNCWSWHFVRLDNGGAIGVIGHTGLSLGYPGSSGMNGLAPWIEVRFFHAYANQDKTFLGEAHAQSLTDYINIIGNVDKYFDDRKTIETFALIGDPSLKIGGYPSVPTT
jgi:hypothetical protein